jgi:cell division protein FtsB
MRVLPRLTSRAVLRRRFAWLVGGAVLLWLGVMLVFGDSGVVKLLRARAKLGELERRVAELEAANAELRAAISSLEHDDWEVERIAREELMMARPDEEVILVPDPKELRARQAEPVRPPLRAAAGQP